MYMICTTGRGYSGVLGVPGAPLERPPAPRELVARWGASPGVWAPWFDQPGRLRVAPRRRRGWRLITLDCVLRKGTQSNWRGKQARICLLCDAFCPTHSAATSQRHAPAPRQRCIFLKTNSHSTAGGRVRARSRA